MKHPLASALARPPSAIAVVPRILCPSPLDDDALIELSERFRVAGAAALVMRGTALNSVHVVLEEQRRAAGNYPGPLPVVYEPSTPMDDTTLDALHSSGVAGILLPADAMVLPPSAPPLLVVPRCEAHASNLARALTSKALGRAQAQSPWVAEISRQLFAVARRIFFVDAVASMVAVT